MHFLKDLNTCKEGAMMDRDFERAVEFVLAHEKYRANDPHDPGGLTIWGLSSRYHPEVRKMKNMSKEDAKRLQKRYIIGNIGNEQVKGYAGHLVLLFLIRPSIWV